MSEVVKRGPKSTFTEETADSIVSQLSKGVPLAEICRQDGMPGVQTVYDWRDTHPDFAVAIARAREDGFDRIAADCLAIADDKSRDTNGKGGLNKEFAERSKIRIDTRLKLLARWDPKRYGEKLAVEAKVDVDIVALLAAARLRARGEE